MKPECCEYQGKIARYLLGDLKTDERQAFEIHLAECRQCQSEKESYSRTLSLIQSVDDEPVPRHFFVQPKESSFNPWELFRMLKPRWQAITAMLAGLFILAGVGGIVGFTRGGLDVSALKREFLMAAEEQNRYTAENFLQQVRAEIAHSSAELTQKQKTELAAALSRMDTRFTGRLNSAEGRVREDAQKMAGDVYRTVSQQRARDLSLINLRFDGIETKSALETKQTDAILDTLLQSTELRLK